MTSSAPAWAGRLAFGPWWLLYSGPIGPTDPHAHHAFQVVVHAGAPVVVDGDGRCLAGPVAVIEPGVPHAFQGDRGHALIAFIDPESVAGRGLRQRPVLPSAMTAEHPVTRIVGGLRPTTWGEAEDAVQRIVAMCTEFSPTAPASNWQHPAIERALLAIPALLDEGPVDVETVAAAAGLSVSRLTHVFSQEIRMPIRSYARWLRLVRATEELAGGASITEASHRSGFADGAHFSRTFRSMFGLSPAEATGMGTWLLP